MKLNRGLVYWHLNFLNNRNLELVSKILKDVQEKGVTKGNYTGVYPVTTKNILVKILKLDFNQVKKSFLLKNIAKDLHLEKIAENILNDKVDLHMIDSYYNAKSDKNIISWQSVISILIPLEMFKKQLNLK